MSSPSSFFGSTPVVLGLLSAGPVAAAACTALGASPWWAVAGSAVFGVFTAGAVLASRSAGSSSNSQANEHARRMAAGELSIDIDTGDGSDAMLGALQELQNSLRSTLGALRSGADGVQLAAQEIAQGNSDLSARTELAASNLQRAASSMSALTGTVNQTAQSARTANQLASSASGVAQRGGEVVSQVVATMDEISASSKKIADIIGTIDGIAFQTNILALNAAVEAARAGEQGRGFAVVASEVRNLAQRSAEAAREIKNLIGNSVEKVESGSRLVADAGSTMTEIVTSVQRVTDIIGEISAAAAEQSEGIAQVNEAVSQLDQSTQQNAALVEESAAAAESLKEQSRQLVSLVGNFSVHSSDGGYGAAPRPAQLAHQAISHARSAPAPTPAPAAPAPVKAGGDDDWETF